MYITYHLNVPLPEDDKTFDFFHSDLNEEIRDYLVNNGLMQKSYKMFASNYYLFIYLDNGDRVDVKR